LDARRVAWARGASADTVLIAGDPAPVIATMAGELGADLLVIGTSPRPLPSALAARTRRWTQAHAASPVLPINATPPPGARPAVEPVLVP
jgi:nucleotide-binding universal stress UspA family protein